MTVDVEPNMKVIKFKGVDSFNRPVFVTVEPPYWFYGSLDILFGPNSTEEEVLSKITEKDLCYFGSRFDCEPTGTAAGHIKIEKTEPIELPKDLERMSATTNEYVLRGWRFEYWVYGKYIVMSMPGSIHNMMRIHETGEVEKIDRFTGEYKTTEKKKGSTNEC